jgi:hypothetical protein
MLIDDDLIHLTSKGSFSAMTLSSGKKDLVGAELGLKLKTDGDINITGHNIKLGSKTTKSLTLASKDILLVCDDSLIMLDESTGNTDFYATEITW